MLNELLFFEPLLLEVDVASSLVGLGLCLKRLSGLHLVDHCEVEFVPELEETLEAGEDVEREKLGLLHEGAFVAKEGLVLVDAEADVVHELVEREEDEVLDFLKLWLGVCTLVVYFEEGPEDSFFQQQHLRPQIPSYGFLSQPLGAFH